MSSDPVSTSYARTGLSALSAALILLSAAVAVAQSPTVELEAGMEADSNPEREEGAQTAGGLLGRYFLRVDGLGVSGRSQQLSAAFRSGGKLYESHGSEDTVINALQARWTVLPLTEWEARWLFVYLSGSAKDRTEKGHRRDYFRAQGGAGLGVNLGPVTLRTGAATGRFLYKPDARLSNVGPSVDAGASWRIDDAWSLDLGATRTFRDYRTVRFVETTRLGGEVLEDPDGRVRRDRAVFLSAGLSYRGPVIVDTVGTWYANESNSYGQSLVRLGGTLTLTSPLFAGIYGSVRLGLQRTEYADPIFLDETLAVDDDNRNTLVLELTRGLVDSVGIVLRYALYSQEFGTRETDYARQLLFVGLSWEQLP
jgi:hypothetical protein